MAKVPFNSKVGPNWSKLSKVLNGGWELKCSGLFPYKTLYKMSLGERSYNSHEKTLDKSSSDGILFARQEFPVQCYECNLELCIPPTKEHKKGKAKVFKPLGYSSSLEAHPAQCSHVQAWDVWPRGCVELMWVNVLRTEQCGTGRADGRGSCVLFNQVERGGFLHSLTVVFVLFECRCAITTGTVTVNQAGPLLTAT